MYKIPWVSLPVFLIILLPAHTSCEVQMKYHFLRIGLANQLDVPRVSLTKQVMFVYLLKD